MLSLWLLTAGRGKLTKQIASTSHEGYPILYGITSVSLYETRFREIYYSEQREYSTLSSSFLLILAVQSGISAALTIKHKQRL